MAAFHLCLLRSQRNPSKNLPTKQKRTAFQQPARYKSNVTARYFFSMPGVGPEPFFCTQQKASLLPQVLQVWTNTF